jgi:hypothetical protein
MADGSKKLNAMNGEQLFKEVLVARASRLGISVEEMISGLVADRRSNHKRGNARLATVDQLLDDLRGTDPSYPTAECLFPTDFAQAIQKNSLRPTARLHIEKCVICRRILDAMHPNPDQIDEFCKAVQERQEQAEHPVSR